MGTDLDLDAYERLLSTTHRLVYTDVVDCVESNRETLKAIRDVFVGAGALLARLRAAEAERDALRIVHTEAHAAAEVTPTLPNWDALMVAIIKADIVRASCRTW